MEKSGRRISFFLSLLLLVSALTALWQRQAIYDWVRLRDYQPTVAVSSLADAAGMTGYARHIFYVYHPSLEDKAAFNMHCTATEHSIVLGCYVEHQGIYIYDVTDPRLAGIEEVTAAHEMLHAAYDRLGRSEREQIDKLTSDTLAGIQDQRIKDTVERYRERDATVVPNELHSILGTEVRNLPKELEDYYRKYFADRSKVVRLSEQYQQAFTERQEQINAFDEQLKSLQQQINTIQASLEAQEKGLESERARLDSLRAGNRIEEYNAAVPAFNERIRKYNVDVGQARTLIDEYNRIVAERNTLAVEENELIKAIDSRPGTIEVQ